MCPLSLSIILFLTAIVSMGTTIHEGELVEWDLNLLKAANLYEARDEDCGDSFDILCPPGHKAGYFSIKGTGGGKMFYMYFPNRNNDEDAPFVFWTNGGPGSSSLLGMFTENGPYEIQEDLTLSWRQHGWDIGHNIVFVDQPLGVGFSKSSSSYTVTSEEQIGDNMVSFFYCFLEEHPELVEKDLYITGQSFAGHYLPPIARSIMKANSEGQGISLKIKAIIMGNPWSSPIHQFRSDPDFGVENDLITDEKRSEILNNYWDECQSRLHRCEMVEEVEDRDICADASLYCNQKIYGSVWNNVKHLNYFDIRRRDCTVAGCYNITLLEQFMKLESVKRSLGVEQSDEWHRSNRSVFEDLYWDSGKDMSPLVAEILNDGINVFVYVGNKDLICNYLGNKRWIDNLGWNGSAAWVLTEEKEWISGGALAGYVRHSGPLTFVVVDEAGHLVPKDQPKIALDMLTTYTKGGSFESTPIPSPSLFAT